MGSWMLRGAEAYLTTSPMARFPRVAPNLLLSCPASSDG